MINKQEPVYTSQSTFFLRASIVAFCICFAAFFLYLARLKEFFFFDNTLHVYSFTEMISIDSINEFEKETGIKISIKNFESNEELLTKFRITGGEGYDLITPSDYMVQLLEREKLLHKLDRTKLPVIAELDTRLMNHYFDPTNSHSLPFAWVTYGLIFNKSIFNTVPSTVSLDLLFQDPAHVPYQLKMPYKICMVDDFIEATFLANLYVSKNVNQWDDARLEIIKKLLIAQRGWLEAYLHQDIRQFLLSEIFHVAITSSMNMRRMLQMSDDFEFKIPQEGSIMVIENLAIPARCKKIELVYKFINFLLSKKTTSFNSSLYGYNPPNKAAYDSIEERFFNNPNFFPNDETFSRLHLLHNDIPLKKLEELWLEVKSA